MIKSMNIAWWVLRWSELHPSKPAILFKGERISYLELHERANRTGCWLQSLGIEKGYRVAVMVENCHRTSLGKVRKGMIFNKDHVES